jgi:hypothetical protein
MLRAWVLVAALAAPWSARAAEPSATLTILEGEALVYRGAGRLHGAEGLRLIEGDILETAGSSFAQVEFADRAMAQFGPATRAMLHASSGRQKPQRWVYLMDGWAKFAGAKPDASAGVPFQLRTALLEIPPNEAVVVVREAPSEITLFVERGELRVGERQASGAPYWVALRGGDFYKRRAGARGTLSTSSTPSFVAEMPRFFRDSLPRRFERFRDRPAQAREAPGFAYADVEDWLKAEASVRRPLMQRWRGKAREPAFRAALVENLASHPEWDPILFPEKYRPKEPPARAAIASKRPAGAASAAAY